MSAITGITYYDGRQVDGEDLWRMVNKIAYRGLDGQDVLVRDSVGMGHCMLYTTPESLLETYPMTVDGGRRLLTADVRLDNRKDLARRLGCREAGLGDGELILRAYDKWGEDSPEYLVGAFAFAIWDATSKRLFCARDHMGVKPFYYHSRPGKVFAFASEAKALLALREIPSTIDETRVHSCLMGDLDDKEMTAFSGIKRLPPGASLVVDNNGARLRSYWQLDPNTELELGSRDAYVDTFREIFVEAVHCRMRSAYPVGSHLSGGLDSSAVSCVARDLISGEQGGPLATFSNVFEKVPVSDEREYIDIVLGEGGFEPHYIQADSTGPFDHLDELFAHEDEPYISANYFLIRGLNHAMRDAGVRIGLDGFDGDTTLNHGYGHLSDLAGAGHWNEFMMEASALSGRLPNSSSASVFRKFGGPSLGKQSREGRWIRFFRGVRQLSEHGLDPQQLIRTHGLGPWLPKNLRRAVRRPSSPAGADAPITAQQLVNSDFRQAAGPGEPQETGAEALRFQHWRHLSHGIVAHALEGYDRLQAAAGIEVRHPFMDKRLVELCLALPGSVKLNDGLNRWILRAALHHTLPEQIRTRADKANMTPNLVRALTHNRQPYVRDSLQSLARTQHFVDVLTLTRLYDRIQAGSASQREVTLFWRGFCVGMWSTRRRSADQRSMPMSVRLTQS